MTGRPMLGEIERLHQRGKNVKPGAIEPKRVFNPVEIGSVREKARVPGQRLWAVIVGIELINGNCIVANGPNRNQRGESKQRPNSENLEIDCEAMGASTSAETGAGQGKCHRGWPANPASRRSGQRSCPVLP